MLTEEQAIKLYDGVTKILQSEYGWGKDYKKREAIRKDAEIGLIILDEIGKYIERCKMIPELNEIEIKILLNGLNSLMTFQGYYIKSEDIPEYEKSLKLAIKLAKLVNLEKEYSNHNVRSSGWSFWFDDEGNNKENYKKI